MSLHLNSFMIYVELINWFWWVNNFFNSFLNRLFMHLSFKAILNQLLFSCEYKVFI